jgi:hypothetical protein
LYAHVLGAVEQSSKVKASKRRESDACARLLEGIERPTNKL